MVTPGQTIDIDYTVTTASGDSRYIVNNQLVSYGAPNFILDARIVDIKQPSNKTEYLRDNPVCIQPIVMIQNTGSTNLTSLIITYNVQGGTPETYTWQGSLAFLETEEVNLPIPSQAFWNSTAGVDAFEVSVSAPNSGTDGYANNNFLSVPFTKPTVYSKQVILIFRTNLAPFENSYTIKNDAGSIIYAGSGFTSSTLYTDTLWLPNGCYRFDFLDTGQDGIAWWANNDGNGYVWFREIGGATHAFEPDYGAFIRHEFIMDANVGIEENENALNLHVSPNPSNGQFNIAYQLPQSKNGLLQIFDVTGREVYSMPLPAFSETQQINLKQVENGLYHCVITSEDYTASEKIVVITKK